MLTFMRRSVYVSECYLRFMSNKQLLNNVRRFATVKLQTESMLQNRSSVTLDQLQQSPIRKLLNRFKFWDINELKLGRKGFYLYEKTADSIDYEDVIKTFSLPDTFFSWFLIIELHVWLISVRLMTEGDKGRSIRNNMYESMWEDVGKRITMLKKQNRKLIVDQFEKIKSQFRPAIISYDEGLLGGDTVLAGALWRRFFQQECKNAEDIEILIKFIRKQILEFDKLPTKNFIDANITWLSLHKL